MAGCNVFLTDSGLRVYIIVTEKNQVVSVSGSFFIKKSAGVRLYEVIAVYKPDIFSMGMGKTVISCPADAVVLCGKYKKASPDLTTDKPAESAGFHLYCHH